MKTVGSKRKPLDGKRRQILEWTLTNPFSNQAEMAEKLGCTQAWISRVLHEPEMQEALDSALKEQWRGSIKKAQRVMFDLLENGNQDNRFKAAKYVLDSCGYSAPIDVNVSSNEIKIIVKPENSED